MKLKSQQDFIDNIGKRVYRNKGTCHCLTCAKVFEEGLIISDKQHAGYLYDCYCELDLEYRTEL